MLITKNILSCFKVFINVWVAGLLLLAKTKTIKKILLTEIKQK